MYPTRTITIPNYGWKVEIYETSLADIEELQSASNEAFSQKVFAFIKNWDCLNRAGEPLPLAAESLKKLPQSALRFIIDSIINPFKDDDPKNALKP